MRMQNQRINPNIDYKPPRSRTIIFIDVGIFAVIFFLIFFISLSRRSMLYNMVASIALLLKVFVGLIFYNRNSSRSLRIYYTVRMTYNALIITPIILIFKATSPTYVLNYIVTAATLFLGEFVVSIMYS